MREAITPFIGLDVYRHAIAAAVAGAGREEPHFVGTVVPQWTALSRTLTRLGNREGLQIIHEAGPCGYPWHDDCARTATPVK
jgi:hypothetical protein